MSESWLLRREDRLTGTHAARVRVRPRRLGFVVPATNAGIAARAIDSCCLTWGGYRNIIVPASPETGLTEEWQDILSTIDVDAVVDCVGLPQALSDRLKAMGQYVHTWQAPETSFFMDGALQYSALQAFGDRFKSPSPKHYVISPVLSESSPLYLPLIARYGRLRETFLQETLKFHRWSTTVTYDQLIDVRQIDFSGHDEAVLIDRGMPTPELRGEVHRVHRLPQLTLLGMGAQGPTFHLDGGTPERPQFQEGFAEQIIVTGEPGSVSDLALYWDLRAQRSGTEPFPIWIPIDSLDTDTGKAMVDHAISSANAIQRPFLPNGKVYILSSSMTQSQLVARVQHRFPEAAIETQRLFRFLTAPSQYRLADTQAEAQFRDGRARVFVSAPEAVHKFAPMDRIAYEIGIDGLRLPQVGTLHRPLTLLHPRRVTADGALEGWSYVSHWPDFLEVSVPDPWTILTALFEEYGYACSPSDKAAGALGQLALLGGLPNLDVIASSKVHDRLRELSFVRGERADERRKFFADRKTLQFSALTSGWDRKHAPQIVRWLVERRVLFRGAVLKCPSCSLKRWYEIDRISEMWRCDGCQTGQPSPLGLNSTPWVYRINELYALGHDQGTITHLLAMYTLYPPFAPGDSSVLGFYPCVMLRGLPSASVPAKEVEIDVVAVWDGRLILVECKDSGESLGTDEIEKLVQVANHVHSSRLIFVTPTRFPNAEDLFSAARARCTAEVEWWEGTDLFDWTVRERLDGAQTEPEVGRADRYLERVARSLGSRLA